MSNYDNKPGTGAIFKNKRKAADTHPDYQGRIVSLSGEEMDLSLWVNTAKSTGEKYFSVSIQEPWEKRKAEQLKTEVNQPQTSEGDGLPF